MKKWQLVLAKPIEVWADSFNDAIAEVHDNPSYFMELQGLTENEVSDYDAVTMPSTDQVVVNGKRLMTTRELSTGWRNLAQSIRSGMKPTPESDAYAGALEACATSLEALS